MGFIESVNDVLWHNNVLFVVLAVGVLFTIWSGFCQFRSLTHGVALVRGKYDHGDAPGAISHFQALSTALSATVGLGNIAGVAIAVSIGGPGAVFWMWVTGLIGMALKTTEVTQSMLYRNVEIPDRPRGGPMWVASQGFKELSPRLAWFGKLLATLFCLTLLVSTITGGNMFQAWNVADITKSYFGVPQMASGLVMTGLVALVILGGIKRIGQVAERLVPVMCLAYLLAGVLVLFLMRDQLGGMFRLIFSSAFNPSEASGAFIGGSLGWAFLKGMQRALFSNEAGQGSSPIAHSAAKTKKPVSEGVVAGLEPFVDTLVVCTITALVILSSGVWNRPPDLELLSRPQMVQTVDGSWTLEPGPVRTTAEVESGTSVFAVVSADPNPGSGNALRRLSGVLGHDANGQLQATWSTLESTAPPRLHSEGAFMQYTGATLTARAFDKVVNGLGLWLVPITVWLFALSTMESWSYYGEKGIVYILK